MALLRRDIANEIASFFVKSMDGIGPRRALRFLLGVGAAVWLTGCAPVVSDVAWLDELGVCPPLITYDDDILTKAAEELSTLPGDGAVVAMLEDYEAVRAFTRTCIEAE